MGRKWMAFADVGRINWGREFETDADGAPCALAPGETEKVALFRLVALAELTAAYQQSILKRLAPPPRPEPAPPDPQAGRAQREAGCRARAWAAYLAAGGTAEADPGDLLPDPRTPIAALGLSVRARKAATRLSLATVGELVALTAADLLAQRNFGTTTLAEVREKLAARGLALRGERAA